MTPAPDRPLSAERREQIVAALQGRTWSRLGLMEMEDVIAELLAAHDAAVARADAAEAVADAARDACDAAFTAGVPLPPSVARTIQVLIDRTTAYERLRRDAAKMADVKGSAE